MTHDPTMLDGILPLSPALDAPGWVARTAGDLARLASRFGIRPAPHAPYRLGILREATDCDPRMRESVANARKALIDHGHAVTVVEVGELWSWRSAAWDLCTADTWAAAGLWARQLDDELHESTLRAIQTGADISAARQAEIRAELPRLRATVDALFAQQGVDAWLLPLDPDLPRPADPAIRATATSMPAPGDPDYDREIGYTPLASISGLPAITLPVGVDTAEVAAPMAVQLVAPTRQEGLLIRLAADIEERLGVRTLSASLR
jgi:Asp-tRNA(Asn)/Glu-tRNA(Gln) amidotransferase A subunit family amidase